MAFFSRSQVASIAIVAGVAVVASTGGAVAGAMITGAQIKDGTVTSADIANGSLVRGDLAVSARGVTSVTVLTAAAAVAAGDWSSAVRTCPSGTKALSADAWLDSSRDAVQVELAGTTAKAYSPIVETSDTVRLRVLCAVW